MASIHVEEPIEDEQQSQEPQPQEQPEITQNGPDPTQPQQTNQKKPLLSDPNKRLYLILAVVLLLFVGFVFKSNNDKQQLEEQVASLQQPQKDTSAEDEAAQLKEEIGQFLELPQNEEPTVVTVVDADKVRNQSFFKNAQNGDKVLLYATSGKAILYRPSTKKVIEVAPINLGNNQQTTPSENTTPTTN